MKIEEGQIVYVSVFNRYRSTKPYCKPHKVMQITSNRIKTAPLNYEDVPAMWLSFGKSSRVCKPRGSTFVYEIFESEEAFLKAERNGHFKGWG